MTYRMPAKAGQLYRPSNGTESMRFEERWCVHCAKVATCTIWLDAWAYEIDESEYPHQLVYDIDGLPMCMVFEPKP